MLNPTEVHLLVGFLIKASSQDAVEIELGSRVWDSAADEEREVDITLTCRRTPKDLLAVRGLRAIEVKRHRRRLTVEHVEQLSRKFDDMPSVNERWIVSASGYSDGAINKGEAHGIELLALRPWDGKLAGGKGHQIDPNFSINLIENRWLGTPRVTLVQGQAPSPADPPVERTQPVVGSDGAPFVGGGTLQQLSDKLALDALNACHPARESPEAEVHPFPVEVRVNLKDPAFLVMPSGRLPLEAGIVRGTIAPVVVKSPPRLHCLTREADGTPIAGCAIGEGPNGGLMGVLIAEGSLSMTVLHIPVGDRLLQKIRQRVIAKPE